MESVGALAFRPFEAGDVPQLEVWLTQAGLGDPLRVDRSAMVRRLLEDGRILVLTALRDREVAGFVRMDLAPDRTAELTLIVDPRARRTGIGRRLLERALDEARSRGLGRVFAVVSHDNRAGQAFFADAGFEPSGARVPGFDHLERFVHRSDRQSPLEIIP